MPIKLSAKVVAYGFPALIAFLGFALMLFGYQFSKPDAVDYGWKIILIGVGLYLLYLPVRLIETRMRTGRRRR
jgi:hypothetical protein